MKEYYYFGNT